MVSIPWLVPNFLFLGLGNPNYPILYQGAFRIFSRWGLNLKESLKEEKNVDAKGIKMPKRRQNTQQEMSKN